LSRAQENRLVAIEQRRAVAIVAVGPARVMGRDAAGAQA
jgi:hypothetical protein